MSEIINGVIIGGLISAISSILTAIVVNYFNAQREKTRADQEANRLADERRSRIEKSAIDYFRENFHLIAPFLALESKFNYIMGGQLFMEPPGSITKPQSEQISELLPSFHLAYEELSNSGFLALIPNSISGQIMRYGNFLNVLIVLTKDTGIDMSNEKIRSIMFDIMGIGAFIKDGIRQLMDVDSLDDRIKEFGT